ncbi:MAG: hypothetical protein KDA96_23475, partial [Planctomycetaceae bacterium]|nr:hypothetical protein [Planctomycetaceae bacterium]
RMFGQAETVLRDPNQIKHIPDDEAHTLAARITNDSKETPLNAIYCADVDLVSDLFFELRRTRGAGVDFDNVTFVLNCVDVLAGDDEFVALRSRRPTRRTLEYVEQQTSNLQKEISDVEEVARAKMDEEIDKYEKGQEEAIAELEANTEMDANSKRVRLQQMREELRNKLESRRDELETNLNDQIRKEGLRMRQEIRRVERRVQLFAWVVPAVIPICLGMFFLGLRGLAESNSVNPSRRR